MTMRCWTLEVRKLYLDIFIVRAALTSASSHNDVELRAGMLRVDFLDIFTSSKTWNKRNSATRTMLLDTALSGSWP